MIILPDTSLVWNFHVLERLDLVRSIRDTPSPKKTGWSVVIHDEVARRIPEAVDELEGIFGEYSSPTRPQMADTQVIRDQIFFKAGDGTKHHMGESETIAIWADEAPLPEPIIFLTEDVDVALFCWRTHVPGSRASGLAGGRKFTPVTTADVLASAVTRETVTKEDVAAMRRRLDELGQPYIGHGAGLREQMQAGKHPQALDW